MSINFYDQRDLEPKREYLFPSLIHIFLTILIITLKNMLKLTNII